MNPHHHFVSELDRLVNEGRRLPLGGCPAGGRLRPVHEGGSTLPATTNAALALEVA